MAASALFSDDIIDRTHSGADPAIARGERAVQLMAEAFRVSALDDVARMRRMTGYCARFLCAGRTGKAAMALDEIERGARHLREVAPTFGFAAGTCAAQSLCQVARAAGCTLHTLDVIGAHIDLLERHFRDDSPGSEDDADTVSQTLARLRRIAGCDQEMSGTMPGRERSPIGLSPKEA